MGTADAASKAKPAPTPLQLQASISQARGVIGQPPTLRLSLQNVDGAPQTFWDTTDPACFVFHYLHLSLQHPDGRVQTASAGCQMDDWPGGPVVIKPGAYFHRTIPLRPFFAGDFPVGHYVIKVALAGSTSRRPAVGTRAQTPSADALQDAEFDLQKPLQTFVIKKGQTQRLSDGSQLRFDGHSHKDVMPGQESPLLIHGKFAAPGHATLQEFSLHAYPEESTLLRIAERYLFVLADYAYGEHMRLHYLGPEPKNAAP